MKKSLMQKAAAVILSMAVCACGCGSAEGRTPDIGEIEYEITKGTDIGELDTKLEDESEKGDGTIETGIESGYYFTVNGVSIQTDMDMDEIAEKLGECKEVFEAPSCAGEGISYLYNYISYGIETYPAQDGTNKIGYITLKDDTVATAEGVDLSMTKVDVILVYGEDYDAAGNQITYEKDGTKLNFIFDGDNIESIEYVSPVIG